MSEAVLIAGVSILVSRDRGGFSEGDDFYHRDTRYLSGLTVAISDGTLKQLDVENQTPGRRELTFAESPAIVNGPPESPEQALVLSRTQSLTESNGLAERLEVTNYAPTTRTTELSVSFDVDFADLFEVREIVEGRDRDVAAEPTGNGLRYEYGFQAADGTDSCLQSTVSFSDRPDELVPGRATFELTLPAQASRTLSFAVIPSRGQPETDADAGDGDDPLATRRFDRAAATQPSISPLFESEEGPITSLR
jgi:hypothetical protein